MYVSVVLLLLFCFVFLNVLGEEGRFLPERHSVWGGRGEMACQHMVATIHASVCWRGGGAVSRGGFWRASWKGGVGGFGADGQAGGWVGEWVRGGGRKGNDSLTGSQSKDRARLQGLVLRTSRCVITQIDAHDRVC